VILHFFIRAAGNKKYDENPNKMSPKHSSHPIIKAGMKNLPNALTLLRIAILPFFAVTILHNMHAISFAFVVIAGITDYLDGYLARSQKQESNFGKLMDPVADKLVLCVSLIFLTANPFFDFSPWLASLLLAREFLITGIRALIAAHGFIMGAQMMGKLKATFQFLGLGLLFLGPMINNSSTEWIYTLGLVLLWLSAVLSYVSLLIYSKKAYFLLSTESKS
jgi:CDP-diacylglycerol--glycerol-3-phosphate 3-phosphatidyltransferase